MNTAIMPRFADLAKREKHKKIVCDNPYHDSAPPHCQELFCVYDYRGHKVSVTIDMGEWNVRVDDDPSVSIYRQTREQAFAFVEEKTK